VVVLGGKDANLTDANAYGTAFVFRGGEDTYWYDFIRGDPLRFMSIPKVMTKGMALSLPIVILDSNHVLDATIDGYYPDPLERVWRAHYGLVEHPPDVIISLEDRFYSGSTSFGGAVNVASTHGGLNKRNCTAFIMSSVGNLPPFMRSRDVPANMRQLTGAKFPMGK